MTHITRRQLLAGAAGALGASLLPATSASALWVAPLAASTVLESAASHLGEPYVYGGVRPGQFDCSSYVSWIWEIPRRTTDTFAPYVEEIDKHDLMPGDAMNRPFPGRMGHIRVFDGWATADRKVMWVYECVRRLGVAYHVMPYQENGFVPIRRLNLNTDVPLREAKLPADYPIAGGHFFSQAIDGKGEVGFTVTDEVGVPMLKEFQRLGGIEKLGFPISGRFEVEGMVMHGTTKGVLTWVPGERRAELVEKHDLMKHAGYAWKPIRSPGLPRA